MEYPSREEIRTLCTDQSFTRGVNYWKGGQIQELEIDGGEIDAMVRGTYNYDVSIDVAPNTVQTFCSCPYDYMGDCKHVVAVLLAAADRATDTVSEADDESDERLAETVDVDALVDGTAADDLRTFLLNIIEDDREVRDRFVAFAGEETGKTVHDYKRDINRLFEGTTNRRGMVEYDTRIDFSQYYDLAATHRERDHVDSAAGIYRALAEAIRENMNRIDDSSGHYGRELERAVESYAETIEDADLDHNETQPYIEYLLSEFIEAEYSFARDDYDDALKTLCTTEADLEYWLDRLDTHLSGVSLKPATIESRGETSEAGLRTDDDTASDHERTDAVLYASDFTDGPLTTDDFTGGTLDVEHLAVGTLEFEYFVGDAFEELRVDEPTTVEQHTVDIEPTRSRTASSLRTRNVLSTYVYVLSELGEEDALSALYERIYLEHSQFCKQYAERLVEQEDEKRAIEVVEDGIETFRSPLSLRWLAVDLYRDENPEAYRNTLQRLFLDHAEWDAYDELNDACDEREWASIFEEFERYLEGNDRRRLIDVYVHEDKLQKAFVEVRNSQNLSWFRRYQGSVAEVDPEEYFELYKGFLVPFATDETGRRHYQEITDHLDEMQGLVSQERFEEFVGALKQKHSNRPAFLDELDKAGF